MRLHNQARPRKVGNTVLLIGACLGCSRLSALICHVQRNNRSNFLCHYVFIIVILRQITFSQFSESENAQPCWLIQVLLQLITGVRVLQIAPFQHRSNKNEVECTAANTEMWDPLCQLMSYFARKHFSWLWPAAVLINSRGILIVASAFFWEQSLFSFLIDSQRCYSCLVTGTRYKVN